MQALETEAEKWLISVSPTRADDVNPFARNLSTTLRHWQ